MTFVADLVASRLAAAPHFRGKARLLKNLGRFAARWNGGTGTCTPARGFEMQVDLHDRIQCLMWGGAWEPHVRRAISALLSPGDIFFDIGAHIGYYSLIAAERVGPAGSVFSFEADPNNFRCLSRNTQKYPLIHPVHAAVWESPGVLQFERSLSASESGWGTVANVRTLGGELVEVSAISLDDWIASHPLKAIELIKLDTEGSEPAILRGASAVFTTLRPALILEMNDVVLRQSGSSSLDLGQALLRLDYTLFELSYRQLTRIPINHAAHGLEVLAAPAEREGQILKRLSEAGFRV